VPYLHEQGHRILNLDATPLHHPGVTDARGDITDLGQVYSVLNSYAGFDEIDAGGGRRVFDAVVHFAASVLNDKVIPADPETWRINVMGTFNILEAATKMGVRKIVIASSETVYGMCLADGMPNPERLPLEEDFTTSPTDAYGLSKRVGEVTAAGFQKRTGADIYAAHRKRAGRSPATT
jgi:nucleoside-diphosphate-sugar epimerase